MRKLLLILPLLPAIALANPPMFGEPPCGENHPPKHHKMGDGEQPPLPEFLKQIDLTETQRTAIKALFKANREEVEGKMEQERTLMHEGHSLSFSNDYSEEKVLALLDKSTAIHKDIVIHKAQLDNAIFKLLSVEQQQKLQGKLAQFKD